jgi:hypothetical protein
VMPIESIISRRTDNARVKITFDFCFSSIVCLTVFFCLDFMRVIRKSFTNVKFILKAISLTKRVNMIEGCRRVNVLNVCVLSFQNLKISM